MKVAVVTAIFGGYDDLKPHPEIPGVDFICYTDNPTPVAGWDVRKTATLPSSHPRLEAKYWKMFAALLLPAHDFTVWIDGSFLIHSPSFVAEAVACIGESGIAMFPHPWRDCIYDEADASVGLLKYQGLPIYDQVAEYRKEGHPEHWGLWATGAIARANTAAVDDLMEAWWAENEKWTYQDQLSFPVVCRRMGVRPDVFPHHLVTNPWTAIHGHHRED